MNVHWNWNSRKIILPSIRPFTILRILNGLIDKGGRKVISRVLKDLGRIEGVNGSLVVGKDGLIIERDVSSDIDSELVGAMSSAVFGTAERSSEEMKHDKLQQVMIEGNKGKTLMIDSGEAILAVITDTSINLGLIRLEMKRSSDRIMELL